MCVNKKCPDREKILETAPLGRLVKIVLESFVFEHKESGNKLDYNAFIKQQKTDFKNS